MKKQLFSFLAVLTLLFPLVAKADEDVSIILVTPETPSEVIHRSPVPITCTLISETLLVNFLDSLGTVSVEIENHTTSEYVQTQVDAQAGPMLFLISGTAGYWTISFTLSNGLRYEGAFCI